MELGKRTVVKLTDEDIRQNLTARYKSADSATRRSGRVWYSEAQTFVRKMSKKYGISRYKVAGVTARLSPKNRWEQNKKDAEAMLAAFVAGEPVTSVTVCNTHTNRKLAWEILTDERDALATSPKVHSFAMNVGLQSPDHITIDSWHIRACLTKPGDGVVKTIDSITEKQYRRIEAITAELAGKARMKGFQYQAIIWLAIKLEWNR